MKILCALSLKETRTDSRKPIPSSCVLYDTVFVFPLLSLGGRPRMGRPSRITSFHGVSQESVGFGQLGGQRGCPSRSAGKSGRNSCFVGFLLLIPGAGRILLSFESTFRNGA